MGPAVTLPSGSPLRSVCSGCLDAWEKGPFEELTGEDPVDGASQWPPVTARQARSRI